MKFYITALVALLSTEVFSKELYVVDLAKELVFLFGEKDEFYIPIYEAPSEQSKEINKIVFHTGSRDFRKNPMWITERMIPIEEQLLQYSSFCGGQYFALTFSDEFKNGLYKIQLGDKISGWIKTRGYSLTKDYEKIPLSLYSSSHGEEIEFLESKDPQSIRYKILRPFGEEKDFIEQSYSIDGILKSKKESHFRFDCDSKSLNSIATKLIRPQKRKFSEPIIVNFLEDRDKTFIGDKENHQGFRDFEIREALDIKSKLLGVFRINEQFNEPVKFKSPKSEVFLPFEMKFLFKNYCSRQKVILQSAKAREGHRVNIGQGPWGKAGWISLKSYGLFTDAPFDFLWLSESNSVRLRKEGEKIVAHAQPKWDNRYVGECGGEPFTFPVNYDDLFDDSGELKIEVDCDKC